MALILNGSGNRVMPLKTFNSPNTSLEGGIRLKFCNILANIIKISMFAVPLPGQIRFPSINKTSNFNGNSNKL